MILLLSILSALMGLTLGLLGGGGSILTVPLLHYVAHVEAREAIATSLLIVAITSLVVTVQHARAGHVRWKAGAVFGGVAMIGAYLGGLASAFFSGTSLLLLFAGIMVAAGVAMLRRRPSPDQTAAPRPPSLVKAAAEGLIVGAVTGLVGAGGGFLVVPALVLLMGLDMRSAVGTSTLIIAMKSFAGFAGHASHVQLDYELAALITAFAVAGSFVGAALVKRIDPAKLRKGFGVFVLIMAAFIFFQEAPAWLLDALFVTRWPFWAGGLAIGGFVLLFLLSTGKPLGVSTGFQDACEALTDASARRSWRLPFIGGLIGGGLVAALLGGLSPTWAMGAFDATFGDSIALKAAVFTGGGVLVGFGARLAGGCTSGHGIVGMAQLAPSSIIATISFMIAGFATTHILLNALGA